MKPNWLTHCSLNRTYAAISNAKYVNTAQSGKDNFEKDFQKSHVKTTPFQKFLLGVGSGVLSLTSPYRGDMIAVMGEVTGYKAWEYIQSKMMKSEEGRRILEEKPRISSGAVDLEKLKTYPEGTLGKAYSNFLEKYSYSPDTRNAVQFVDDLELAYVAQRYREAHDLFHTLLNMPTNMLGEVTVKWVEAIQLKLPMCAAGALFGSVRLAPKKHPGVMSLLCGRLPESIEANINSVLKDKNKKQIRENGEKLARKLEERHVPLEFSEIQEKKQMLYEARKRLQSEEDSEQNLQECDNNKLKYYIYNWKPIDYSGQVCFEYLMSRAAAEYAVLKRVFNEIAQRDKDFAPKTLFDFGSGVGTVVWAANDFWGSTIDEYYCVDASRNMNELAALILRNNYIYNEPIIKNVYYRQFLPARVKLSDIVVSSFSFFEIANCQRRMKVLTTLWNNTNKYLVLIENGTNAGFSLVNEARDYLLRISQQFQVSCHIFAPCPHELECPRWKELSKKTPCNFNVKYDPLRLYDKSESKNQRFCFLIMKKGEKLDKDERLWRIVREPKKRHKHVVCQVCTNEGDLRVSFVAASKFGKFPYQCIRRSKWGDLFPGVVKANIQSGTDSSTLISDGGNNQISDGETDENVEK